MSTKSDARLRVREAKRSDLLAVHRIERASFPQPWPYKAFERFLGVPAFLVAVDPRREDEEIDLVGDDAGPVLGYVVGDVVEEEGRRLGHVKDFAVHPDRRGEGIGSTLMERALVRLAGEGGSTVKLEVRDGNEAARSLYRRFGFEPSRRVSGYYGDGETAVVMVRDP